MIFTDWTRIDGIKFGLEFVPVLKKGQNWILQLDLLVVRCTFTYYGQKL